MMNKKRSGQAALEFLMTYGWAFLVVIVAIGALAYFGVFNMEDALPERCTFPQELPCTQFQVKEDEIKFEVKNNVAPLAEISTIQYKESQESSYRDCAVLDPVLPQRFLIEETIIFTCDFTKPFAQDRRVKLSFKMIYNLGDADFNRTGFGEVYANVQQ